MCPWTQAHDDHNVKIETTPMALVLPEYPICKGVVAHCTTPYAFGVFGFVCLFVCCCCFFFFLDETNFQVRKVLKGRVHFLQYASFCTI